MREKTQSTAAVHPTSPQGMQPADLTRESKEDSLVDGKCSGFPEREMSSVTALNLKMDEGLGKHGLLV